MERCTGKITDWLIKCGAVPEIDRELYEYAIYSILLSLSPMLLALAIGALFGSVVQGVLTITPFSSYNPLKYKEKHKKKQHT